MSASNDGGNAFPLPIGTCNRAEPAESDGMSLRDYFAAKAMQGCLADPGVSLDGEDRRQKLAVLFYQMADAMLVAREVQS